MSRDCTDSRPMPPAACALLVRRAADRSAWFFGRLQFQVAKDEKFLEFLARDRVGEALVTLQDDGGFEGVADQFPGVPPISWPIRPRSLSSSSTSCLTTKSGVCPAARETIAGGRSRRC